MKDGRKEAIKETTSGSLCDPVYTKYYEHRRSIFRIMMYQRLNARLINSRRSCRHCEIDRIVVDFHRWMHRP